MNKQRTKEEYVQALRALADKLEALDKLPGNGPTEVSHYFYDKKSLVEALRIVGGKWTKSTSGNAEYSSIYLRSDRFPILFMISRDKVCTKTVTFNCEPMFSPDEETELDSELLNA